MLRKSLIVTLGFLGLFLAGTAAGTASASAGYSCGPWNNWCRPVCAPWNGWCSAFFRYPRYSWDGHGGHHGHHNWGKSYSHKNWNGGWNKGKGKHNYQAYKKGKGSHYR